MLAVKEATVRQITKDLGISSASVTQHHLKQLRIDGLPPPLIPLSKRKAQKQKDALLKVIKKLDEIINN